MVQIIPAILDKTPEDFGRHIKQLENSSAFKAGWVHIDFADNIFVQNKTIELSVIAKYPTSMHKEAHLMVQHPGPSLEEYIHQGFERIIIHIESDDNTGHDDLLDNLHQIEDHQIQNGLAIKFNTPIKRLIPYLTEIDVVLIMSIEPGFQGQPFIEASLDRIKQAVELRDQHNPHVKIGVDGAVKDDNIREIVAAGADFVTVGSYLLNGDIDENLENLWEKLNE